MSITLVTGASQNHFKSLCQFLRSTEQYSIWKNVYVYDLGLNEESRVYLQTTFSIILRTFEYERYPSFFNINVKCGEYAWKPAIIKEIAQEVQQGLLLWCDSGNRMTNGIYRIMDLIKQQGIYSPDSNGNVQKWSHPGMLSYFSILKEDPILSLCCRNGAILGFDLDQSCVVEVIAEYNRLAHIKECIAPEGSSRDNHRQDQALFTILYYRYTSNQVLDTSLNIHIHQDCD